MRNHENLQQVVAAIIINAKSLYANIFGEKKTKEKKNQKQKKQLQNSRIFYEVWQPCITNFIDLTKSINTARFEKLPNNWD